MGKRVWSTVLAIAFAILMLPSVLLLWVQRDVFNADNYLSIVSPLASDPGVQTRLTDEVTTEIVARLDVPALVGQITEDLPPRAAQGIAILAKPLEASVAQFVDNTVQKVVSSDQFATVWTDVNKAGHAALMSVLSGDGKVLQTQDDAVYVQLGPIVESVKSRLVSDGFERAAGLPSVDRQFELVSSPMIGQAQRWYDVVKVLIVALPILALIVLAAALLLATARWKTLFQASMGTSLSLLVLLAVTYLGRTALDVGVAVYDAFAGSLRTMILFVLVIAVATAIVSWMLSRRQAKPAQA